jgi:protein phosphatase PTC7
VSSSGKGRRFNPDKNSYNFDPEIQDALGLQVEKSPVKKRRNRPDSGQDAFFVSKVGKYPNAFAFGVADGVGGWIESGVDPADFSHGLCSYMAQTALEWTAPVDKLRARALMQMGYESTSEDSSIFAGGSTACVGIARDDGKLELAKYATDPYLEQISTPILSPLYLHNASVLETQVPYSCAWLQCTTTRPLKPTPSTRHTNFHSCHQ